MQKITTSVCVVGGGQAGLSCGYHLAQRRIPYIIVDSKSKAGGSWQRYWSTLRLFSPGKYSTLAGDSSFLTDHTLDHIYPSRDQVIEYFETYESRNKLNCFRPVRIRQTEQIGSSYLLHGERGGRSMTIECKAIINCTGNIDNPFIPYKVHADIPLFKGKSIHCSNYQSPLDFVKQRVAVVGEGNSGAQILAEIAAFCDSTIWITKQEPTFYGDHIDGRILFDQAHSHRVSLHKGDSVPHFRFSSVVMVPSVKEAREKGVFVRRMPPPSRFLENGLEWESSAIVSQCAKNIPNCDVQENRVRIKVDAIIWCTGFSPALDHLKPLIYDPPGDVTPKGQSTKHPLIWFVGYGDWCGYGSGSIAVASWFAEDTVASLSTLLT